MTAPYQVACRASKGILTAMLGGEGAFVDQVKNILSSFAKNIVHLGPAVLRVKAVNNSPVQIPTDRKAWSF